MTDHQPRAEETSGPPSPHDVWRKDKQSGATMIEGIAHLRREFGLSLEEAKEVIMQADGVAGSLDEHLEKLTPVLDAALNELEQELKD